MALYPELPYYADISKVELKTLYQDMVNYAAQLKFLLEQRDSQLQSTPTSKIYAVVTVSNIGRAAGGDIAFSVSSSKFKGFVSGTGWVDFN